MNHQSIRSFLAIVEHKSISAAARALHFSPQTISEQLYVLEKHLGVQLALREKGNRSIVLTAAGRAFIQPAQQWMELHAQAEEAIDSFVRNLKKPFFRLAASVGAHDYIVNHIIQKLRQVNPNIQLQLSNVETREMAAAISDSAFDAAFYFGAPPVHPFISSVPLFYEERYILCPAETPLPNRTISLEELDPRYEVRFWNPMNEDFNQWFAHHFPADAEPFFRTSSLTSSHKYLTDPRCWTFSPASIATYLVDSMPDKLTVRRVIPTPPKRFCNLLISKACHETEIIRQLLSCCEAFIDERPYLQRAHQDMVENE